MKTETIREPMWSAGRKYNWQGDPTGVGLNIKYLKEATENELIEVPVTISTHTKTYTIPKWRARELYKEYNSVYKVKGQTLIVLPLKEFDLSTESLGQNLKFQL